MELMRTASPILVAAWVRATATFLSLITKENPGDTDRCPATRFILVLRVSHQSRDKIPVSEEKYRLIVTNVFDSLHAPQDSARSASGNLVLTVAPHGVGVRQ
jgi:hypothetical protein